MRPRHWISLAVLAVLLTAGVWSFYDNVIDPHDDGVGAGAIESTGSAAAPTTSQGPPGAADDLSTGSTEILPPTLAGWELGALVSGDPAIVSVERLHGKDLGAGIVEAWVGEYGRAPGGPAHATVWVSRSPDSAAARELYVRMTERIGEGNSPFTGMRPIEDIDVEGYRLDGMGQAHYYFLVDEDLYWLAVDADVALTALDELLARAAG